MNHTCLTRPHLIALGLLAASPAVAGNSVPDFSLVDQNTTSPRYGQAVSPRDYLHQVSGYYFGSAT